MCALPVAPAERLIAHRGYAARWPENTLPAFEAALAAGGRHLELDVQLSRDGAPMLFHDRDLQRLCRRPGAVHELSRQELETLRVHGPGATSAPMLTLSRFVDWFAACDAGEVFVELKRISLERFGIKRVLDAVLPRLAPLANRCVVISYALPALRAVRARSDLPIGAVFDDWVDHRQPAVQSLQADWWLCDIDSLPDEGPIAHPGRLAVYECDDPAQAGDVLSRGVDRVETFAIGELLAALTTR